MASRSVEPFLGNRLLNGSPCAITLLSVCGVGVLWPNGWMDEDETWHAGRPRPWPHCVRWRPSFPSPKRERNPQFSAHVCCGEMAVWIRMPLDMEVGLSSSDFVLDGDPAPPPKKGAQPPIIRIPLGTEVDLSLGDIVLDGDPAPPPPPQFSANVHVAKRLDGLRCHLVWR